MLYQKLYFLDNFCLEPTRRFQVKSRNGKSPWLITWSQSFEASIWKIQNKPKKVHKRMITSKLVETLSLCDVDLEDFEREITKYLKAYGAHLNSSSRALEDIIRSHELSESEKRMGAFTDRVFNLLESMVHQKSSYQPPYPTKAATDTHSPEHGYDLSSLPLSQVMA